jgi:lipopolysaccharide export LptBFGC system permease protein LptF
MRRPGTWLRRIAAQVCEPRTMERLIDPTLADLQTEYTNAIDSGRTWESRRIRILGCAALVNAVVVHAAFRATGILHDLTGADLRVLLRTLGVSTAVVLVGTLVVAAVPFFRFVSLDHPGSGALGLLLIPHALPLAIPIGLTFGILWALGTVAASHRSRALVVVAAMVASAVSFTTLGWVGPTANQAFRVSINGGPLAKGANELTLRELDQLLEPGQVGSPADLRALALNYHTRWALAVAPLVLAVFALVLTSRRQCGRLTLALAGCITIGGYYAVLYAVRNLGLVAYATAWIPNAGLLALSVALMKLPSERSARV